jgi:hypothetical protein
MDHILRELSLQNAPEREPPSGRGSPPGDSAAKGSGDAKASGEAKGSGAAKGEGAGDADEATTERTSGDFRAPEGAQSASVHVPSLTIKPRPTEKIETVTVQVDDPRRWPTVRLPREKKPPPVETARSGRAPRGGPPEDTAPTLRSSINAAPAPAPAPRRSLVRWWAIGVVIAALASGIIVALASHIWSSGPEAPPKDAPQPSASQAP